MKFKVMILLVLTLTLNLYSNENYEVDWKSGVVYSLATFISNKSYDSPRNNLEQLKDAKEQAKINFYRALQAIEYSDRGVSLYEHIDQLGQRKSLLLTLLDRSKMTRLQYIDQKVRVVYGINLYGESDSIMNIVLNDVGDYARELPTINDNNYNMDYTGLIIDARGMLKSFSGDDVKIKPSLFLTVRDTDGRIVFNRHNVKPSVMIEKGMVRYTYDPYAKNSTDRVGAKPLKFVAYGAGNLSGSVIVISNSNANKILSSKKMRNAIANGRVEVIVNKDLLK